MSVRGPVGVVGLGVMGGSLARALTGQGVEVVGFDTDPAVRRAALSVGAVARTVETAGAAGRGTEWWIVATPLATVRGVCAEASGEPPRRVMDLASLQRPALAAVAAVGLGPIHVSAHPMAGSERSGFEAADGALYEGAVVWLSTGADCRPGLADEAESFWRAVGAVPAWTGPEAHDERMAAASHLPQLTANALVRVIAAAGLTPRDLGPGGRDMTRLAASSPTLWRDLLEASGDRAVPLLRSLEREIATLADRLEERDLDEVGRVLAETRAWRRS